ncbi:hypothetical protein [Nocardia sp. NPDC058666]|uniref:hypothetical protein n=1 Tax=Nocardia sp. NPDC058666 TaxID=3346587 RepID=UPI003655032A
MVRHLLAAVAAAALLTTGMACAPFRTSEPESNQRPTTSVSRTKAVVIEPDQVGDALHQRVRPPAPPSAPLVLPPPAVPPEVRPEPAPPAPAPIAPVTRTPHFVPPPAPAPPPPPPEPEPEPEPTTTTSPPTTETTTPTTTSTSPTETTETTTQTTPTEDSDE